MEEKKKKSISNIIIIVLLIILIAVNGVMTVKLFINEDNNESVEAMSTIEDGQPSYSSKDVADLTLSALDKGYENGYEDLKIFIKESLLKNNSSNFTFREIFSDNIVYVYDGEYVFKEINKDLPLNLLKDECFVVNNAQSSDYTIEYIDDELKAYAGIDVSKYQGDIAWDEVASDGIDFAFVRVGFRGYETGALVEDEKARYNIENALSNHIKTGVYFYTQAITVEEAIEEANFVLDIIKDYDINYPIAFDLEVVNDDVARTNNLTTEERVAIVKAFCDTVKEAGYTPMLYGNLATMFSMVEYEEVLDYEKWFAYYDTELYYPYDLAIWQYSYTGKVSGIAGECDLNLAFKDLSTK